METEITKRAAQQFAEEHGYKKVQYLGKYQDKDAYRIYIENCTFNYSGLPLVVLVDKDNNAEFVADNLRWNCLARLIPEKDTSGSQD